MAYYRNEQGVGKAYGAWALVGDGVRAYPAGSWASSDFHFPAVDMPTFRAVSGDYITRTVEWKQGTITYDGPTREGRCYFVPKGTKQRISIPGEYEQQRLGRA